MRSGRGPRTLLLAALAAPGGAEASPEPTPPVRLLASIPMPGVEERIDHLAVDSAGRTLVVACLGNHTAEVIDLEKGRSVRRLDGLDNPTGVAFLPGDVGVVIANAGDGKVRCHHPTTFEVRWTVELGADADNVRVDAEGRVYVAYGEGAIAVLEDGRKTHEMRVKAHPESFQLESKSGRVFVNVPDAGHVAVLDRAKRATVATWPVAEAKAHYPMCLDEANGRLLIGCRDPAKLLVLDTATGKVVSQVEISGDVDDLWLDPTAKRIYLSCGEGFLDVVAQHDANRYERVAKVPTVKLARTCLFVPSTGRLYLAVPHQGEQRAEIRVYATRPQ
jgi:DNA-binding beta-propeller fold protein YncE